MRSALFFWGFRNAAQQGLKNGYARQLTCKIIHYSTYLASLHDGIFTSPGFTARLQADLALLTAAAQLPILTTTNFESTCGSRRDTSLRKQNPLAALSSFDKPGAFKATPIPELSATKTSEHIRIQVLFVSYRRHSPASASQLQHTCSIRSVRIIREWQ